MSDDHAYRRGTLLGLTVAEIFILLIFLLLLSFLALSGQRSEELKERAREVQQLAEEKTERERLESVLREWRPVIEEFETPAQVRTLHRRAADQAGKIDALQTERDNLSQQVEIERQAAQEARKEAESTREDNERLSQRITDLQTEPDDLVQQVEAERQAAQEARMEAESTREDNERLSRQNTDLQTERDDLAQQVEAERQAAQEARKRAEQTQGALEFFRKKGENPPCWYKTVPAGAGKTREKPYYAFDIAVYDDDAMVVRRRDPPPGRAEDDDGPPYIDEARKIGFDQVAYDVRLTNAELFRQMRRIHYLGKTGKVRTYPCIFWVRVWDMTSEDAKTRWKQAHDNVLESLFGTYNVKDDPWPSSSPR